MRKFLLLIPLLLPLAGCASVGGHLAKLFHIERPAPLEVRPVQAKAPEVAAPSPVDRLYRQARLKVEQRAYADALDLLQLARAKAPNDVRVLNAMGVVYDKIGRLDLSTRYYELALANDPGSGVVLANMRYSTSLSEQLAVVRTGRILPVAPQEAAPAALAMIPAPARNTSGAVILASAAPVRLDAIRTGRPVQIVDATGGGGGQKSLRTYLTSAGWSLASGAPAAGVQTPTVIRYPQEHRALAEALARTLPFKVVMADCAARCAGLELVLGKDAPQRMGSFSKEHGS